MRMDLKEIISKMTLEEKAGMCSGYDFWHTKSVDRLKIPAIMVSDGPHGLRKQDLESDHISFNESIKAVCFPTGSAIGSSFDKELINELGKELAIECQAENVSIILGPAVNIKRSPLCGRNFEYLSEDPYLTSSLATSYIKGVQSKNVGTSLKHFLANNQEHRRMTSSSEVDERTLREIYLAAFEDVVKKAKPWTVMCSYNRINGTYASENKRFLTDILRKEWGFDGFVVSDWGAVNDRVKSLKAGLQLEMPDSKGINDKRIIEAVKSGELDELLLNQTVEKILTIIYKFTDNRIPNTVWNLEEHHNLSRKISSECMVLLKNDGLLPLNKNDNIVFIGEFAKIPRYQGGGSSHINSFKTSGAIENMANYENITYAQGYMTEEDVIIPELVKEAVKAARQSKVAVIFAGLPDSFESEGYDRTHMSIPNCQNHLIEEITKVQPNTVIVLHNGSPIEMPWINKVNSILEVYLGGQAVGEATVDILFGDVNPSGKLAETFPIKLKDNPSYLYYFGEKDVVEYREGIFVGYRYYDKKEMDVLFPFGHGLSYTSFEYSNMKINKSKISDNDEVEIIADITNTGKREGKEIIQLYISSINSNIIRPERELKEFTKIHLLPGEKKTVKFTLNKRAFAYFNTEINDWYVEDGSYNIEIGKSSRDIVLSRKISYTNNQPIKNIYTENSTFGDVLKNPEAKKIIEPLIASTSFFLINSEDYDENAAITPQMHDAMINHMPLRGVFSFGDKSITHSDLKQILEKLNNLS
ncbi:MAG: glycoside hydrolase family 3 C-terminal domain-containing protein [Clostridiales bacterium]